MKPKNYYTLFLMFALSIAQYAQSQNPLWSLPPNYNDGGLQPLPTPPPTNVPDGVYDGSPAECTSNAIADANGDLLFFIVDNYVYDGEGYLIGILESNTSGFQFPQIKGTTEMVIVPDPANCERYYIIAAGKQDQNNTNKYPFYAIVDFSQVNAHYSNRMGYLVEYNNSYSNSSTILIPLLIPEFVNATLFSKNQPCYIAASKTKLINGIETRFVFISNGSSIYRFRIDQNGFQYDNYSIELPYSGANQADQRGEMELIELSNGNFRIAVPYMYNNMPYTANTQQAVYIADINQNGELIVGTEQRIGYDNIYTQTNYPLICGLEFSQDGSILYLSHLVNSNYLSAIDYYDLNNISQGIQSLNIANSIDFQYSQIEMGSDYKLYFVGAGNMSNTANRLASLSFTNNPSNSNWNDNILPINYQANYEWNFVQTVDMKRFTLPDQIDGMNYTGYFFNNPRCCILNSFHHAKEFTATSSAVWTNGQNPFGNSTSPILIEKELVIPAGVTVTISNMTFKFATGAKVIVERGSNGLPGGKLILSQTTFTVDDSCDPTAMWNGVQVYGYPNQIQGVFGTSRQGWFEIKDNSKIEHALKGVVAVRISTMPNYPYNFNAYDFSYTGGVIQGVNSTFRNNQVDVEIRKYINTTYANKSNFSNCQFITDGPLKNNWLKTQNHVFLNDVRGIGFYGCDFINLHPELFYYTDRTTGIRSMDATLLVKSKCAGNTIPCSTYDNNLFKDLYYGIYATGGNSNYTIVSDQASYINNYYGIYMKGVNNAALTKNTFEVYRSASPNPQVANYGLFMTGCTGYAVQENYFTEFNDPVALAPGNTHGIIVDNSGELHNEIYKNRFKDITIGGQSQGVNGILQTGSTNHVYSGLQWKCNIFEKNIFNADLAVTSGRIDYQQGYLLNPLTNTQSNVQKALAGNAFSHSGFNAQNDFATNLSVQEFEYIHHKDFMTTPVDFGPVVSPVSAYNSLMPIYYNSSLACLSKIRPQPIPAPMLNISFLKPKTDSIRAVIDSKTGLIDGGNTSALLQTVSTQPAGQVKNALILASPYLSDEVLLAYLQTSPPSGHISQVLMLNSPLSDTVLTTFRNMTIPKGIKKLVNLVQHGTSARTNLYNEINYASSERSMLVNERIRAFLIDTAIVNPYDSIAMILRDERTHTRKIDLCHALTMIGDSTNSLALRDSLAGLLGVDNNIKLIDIYARLRNTQSSCKALLTDISLENEVQSIATDASDRYNAKHAESLVEFAHDSLNPAIIESLLISNSAARGSNNSHETLSSKDIESSLITVYPNPIEEGSPISISWNETSSEISKSTVVEIFNVSGQLVYTQQLIGTSKQITIQSNKLVEGVYLIKLIDNGALLETHKLLIRK